MIRENQDGTFTVYSEGGKRLSQDYKTRDEAQKRLQQVEYFKLKKPAKKGKST